MAFDFERAERWARLCRDVHVASPDVLDGTRWEDCPVRAFAGADDGATSLAAVVDLGDRIVVAFRGTLIPSRSDLELPVKDWMRNLDVRMEPFTATVKTPAGHEATPLALPGKVHAGFHRELVAVLEGIEDTLLALPRRPVVVTGHSQGGAIAVLCARVLEAAGWQVEETVTFAAPRAGDAGAVGVGTAPIHRVEFGHDIVPHVPPILTTGLTAAILAKAVDLAADLEPWLDRWAKLFRSPLPYATAGTLWYAGKDELRVSPYDRAAEGRLSQRRVLALLGAGPALWQHHDVECYLDVLV